MRVIILKDGEHHIMDVKIIADEVTDLKINAFHLKSLDDEIAKC